MRLARQSHLANSYLINARASAQGLKIDQSVTLLELILGLLVSNDQELQIEVLDTFATGRRISVLAPRSKNLAVGPLRQPCGTFLAGRAS